MGAQPRPGPRKLAPAFTLLCGTVLFSQSGCLAAAAGYAGAKLAQKHDVYVCQDAPSAASIQELGRMIQSGDESWQSRAGDRVDVQQRRTLDVQVDGEKERLALDYVKSKNLDRAYWISADALCSGG